jgi:hypothetical protein
MLAAQVNTNHLQQFFVITITSFTNIGCVIANNLTKAVSEHQKRTFGTTKHVDPVNSTEGMGSSF